ncbi:hypothetical protein [Paenibacillus sp. GCM10028914]|uniref:hypothetical protein n=1 Tax=Paenibacillus sp. GCM10028914 TaxID=3273416 RepID=UPI0036132EAE
MDNGYQVLVKGDNSSREANIYPNLTPEAVIIEYHFDGFNPEYAGMDWKSLRLVFRLEEGSWRLSGIIHDEWTI